MTSTKTFLFALSSLHEDPLRADHLSRRSLARRRIYWSKDDDSFVVEVAELPGCMADGQTYAEAVANAEVVIDEWIAVTQRNRARPGFQTARKLGRPIPEPRGKLAYA
jgi:predicted RNase H-like HicB family nuclease